MGFEPEACDQPLVARLFRRRHGETIGVARIRGDFSAVAATRTSRHANGFVSDKTNPGGRDVAAPGNWVCVASNRVTAMAKEVMSMDYSTSTLDRETDEDADRGTDEVSDEESRGRATQIYIPCTAEAPGRIPWGLGHFNEIGANKWQANTGWRKGFGLTASVKMTRWKHGRSNGRLRPWSPCRHGTTPRR